MEAIQAILLHANETKKRNFLETIELQVSLKNWDSAKDKKFSGSVRLPHVPRPRYSVCVLANAKHLDEAQALGVPVLAVPDLEKFKKDKKKVKKLAQSYGAFLASADLIKKIPRLLGPGLNRAGKFPAVLAGSADMGKKIEEIKSTIKIGLKSKKTTMIAFAVANVGMSAEEVHANIVVAINSLIGMLKKGWQNIARIHCKSTMGKSFRIYGL